MQNRGVLGEDKPHAPGPGLDKGCPLCRCASPALLQTRARSLELPPPSLPSGTEPPGAPLQAPLPCLLPALRMLQETLAHLGPGSGTEGSRDLWTPPLPVAVSEPQPHRAPGWEMGMA